MKKTVVAVCAVLSVTACGGSSGGSENMSGDANVLSSDTTAPDAGSSDLSSASGIRDALVAAGLSCIGYATVPKADRDMGQEDAVEVAECESEGESIQIVTWKDNGQRDNFSGMASGFGCEMAKAFGIQTIDWVDGDKWQVTGTSQTLAKQIDKALGGKARHVDC